MFVVLLVDVLRDPRVQDALRSVQPQPAGSDRTFLNAKDMAKALGMSRSTFQALATHRPELRQLRTHKGWPVETVKQAVAQLQSPLVPEE
jgi:predicted DNA-binding transcriptional regulator AlpA